MNNWFKQNGVHFAVAGLFFAICFFYFTPAFQGKVLVQSDVTQAQGMQKEIMDVRAKTGKAPLWTNQVFGGMPAYQIWAFYPANVTTYVISALKTIFPNPIDTVLLSLLGAYLLFCVLRLNPWLAAAGAIAFTFSSYNFILLHAGHSNQAFAITFFAPILAGIILTLRGKHWLGAILTAFFLAMEIRSNHIQMAYYLLFSLLILVGIEFYHAIKNKTTPAFIRSMIWLSGATLIAVMINASILWTTYEYGQESIRGKSNLTQHIAAGASTGLDKEYAYGWSQGIGECITFLIPNVYGGGSGGLLKADSKVAQALIDKGVPQDQATGFVAQLPTYWGGKPFTEGPWYFGAGICFLFVFGLMIIRNRVKWWLLATVILSMLLSFGKNFTLVSDLFFNYFPLYNKFRAVESILVLTQLAFPILGFLAIKEALQAKDKVFILKKLFLALYITGGITLLVALLPSLFFSFKCTTADESLIAQLTQAFQGDSAFANSIVNNALVQDRIGLARADAFRSLVFVLITFGILWAFIKQKINLQITSLLILVVTLVDLWSVDKRYLKDDSFLPKDEAIQVRTPREVDQFILRDPDPDFRVLDLTIDPFSNASTSYFHKTLGGYHAAKLRRFQELIDNQLTKSINQDVLDMLNTKYVITADQKSQIAGMKANATACGHAWFVKKVRFADNADQEMQAISSFDPKDEAIVDLKYQSFINTKQNAIDENGKITLISYAPEHLVYQSGSTSNQVAVFSEIYYDKGWKMLIDGKESPYFRADYLLRAAQIPVGNHKIEFIFHPNSYYTGEAISTAGSILLVLAVIAYIFVEGRKEKTVYTDISKIGTKPGYK
ncbi:MAG: YfhO family protein [Mucilaginibacter sp.]|uniref:YfhO family protein n=1 Tax=Mucilaginibacter sp. TaxID=1882438 RepID=UPI0034E53C47